MMTKRSFFRFALLVEFLQVIYNKYIACYRIWNTLTWVGYCG